jgi:2-oxoisovalerate dehydrogenase E1 component
MAFPTTPAILQQRDLSAAELAARPADALLRIYTWMHYSRLADNRILDLFRQGLIKGTVTGGQGHEGLIVPLALLADKTIDVISFTHRHLGGHLIWSGHLCDHLNQYFANSASPTRAREGNVHYGDPANRALPMISHLGAMLSHVAGRADSQRRSGIPAIGLGLFGEGASSTGDVHETLNLAALLNLPILFIIENNRYAYSTPAAEQYPANIRLSQRAAAYGIESLTIDTLGDDPAETTRQLAAAIAKVRATSRPMLIEAATVRLRGHAAYDTCDYITAAENAAIQAADPLPKFRARLAAEGHAARLAAIDAELAAHLETCIRHCLQIPRPAPPAPGELEADLYAPPPVPFPWHPDIAAADGGTAVAGATTDAAATAAATSATCNLLGYKPATTAIDATAVDTTTARSATSVSATANPPSALRPPQFLTMAQAINAALRKILAERPESLLLGQDIATYGGAFKVTEHLYRDFGRARVMNVPLAESACTGYAIGLALGGRRPVEEFQFADFATDALTQITLNAATYHFRSGAAVPLVLRLPCGGGITMGSFHSQELESVLLAFPGLKALYPSTPQDAFNALLAAHEDDNPVLVFEHKGLYRRGKHPVAWDPAYRDIWRPARLRAGDYATLVTYGEMTRHAAEACAYLETEYARAIDLFDLRCLAPLNLDAIHASLARTHRLIVLHEGRRAHGFGAELVSRLAGQNFLDLEAPPLRIASLDIPVPFAPELEQAFRPTTEKITAQIVEWMG